jgi:hypothetical protein
MVLFSSCHSFALDLLNYSAAQDLEERMITWNDKTTLIGDVLCKFVRILLCPLCCTSSLTLPVSEQVPYLKSYIVYARMNEKAQGSRVRCLFVTGSFNPLTPCVDLL